MRFKGQIPTVEDAADGLGITVRTLQRKLAEEQTSFREIASEVKKELALHLMKNRPGTITEVAEVLGYNDLPAFRRAFKGWTKSTPKEMKRLIGTKAMSF
jgi:AraC-like DNA-binding protein